MYGMSFVKLSIIRNALVLDPLDLLRYAIGHFVRRFLLQFT